MYALAGITDIAFNECCLRPGSMSVYCGTNFQQTMSIGSDRGISVEFGLNNENTWTGHTAVSWKSKAGYFLTTAVPTLDKLIDYIMDAVEDTR